MDTQLLDAIKNGDVNGVQRRLAVGADPSADNNAAFREASKNGYLDIVRLLLADPRVDPSTNYNEAIRDASEHGYPEVVRLLLQDPRVEPPSATIGLAARAGHLEVVRLLLSDPRLDPSAYNNYAIDSASDSGHLEVVRLLLTVPRVDPSSNNNYAIRHASENGHLEVVQLLAGIPGILTATVNYYLAQNEWNALRNLAMMTGCLSESNEDLLVWGAAIGSINLVETLVDRGINPTFDNNLALEAAQQYGRQNVIDYLEMLNVD